jgi:hypothetical protein
MKKVVEVTIDVTSNKHQPEIDIYDVSLETETNYHTPHNWNGSRRFYKPNMNQVMYRKTLKYTYRYITEEDKDKILSSEKLRQVVNILSKTMQGSLDHYQKTLDMAKNPYKGA